jgi:hypothetical protein
MDFAKGDPHEAIKLFEKHLNQLRDVAEVKTICMHGSPLSKHDNRDLWKHYDYRDYGIIAEPYFDLDFSQVLYLTDTGRRWDGEKVSIRDKVMKNSQKSGGIAKTLASQESNHPTPPTLTHNFSSTHDIIHAIQNEAFPDKVMMNFHPQRWTDNTLLWSQELILQNIKNVVKSGIVYMRAKKSN